jgi:hypothetical protein
MLVMRIFFISNKSQHRTRTCLGARCFQWYRSIAHQYAELERGARVCGIVGLREALVNDSEVVAEYQKSQSDGTSKSASEHFAVAADFASVDSDDVTRTTVEASKILSGSLTNPFERS